MFLTILLCLISYCIGSVSSAIIVCRLMHLPDPRIEGSKNPGATNVLRIGGKVPAAITLFGDALKGFIPVFLVMLYDPDPALVGPVMIAVFLGHLYPIFFGFQGGKGVATLIGILFGLSWLLGVLFLVIWIVMAFLFRISSLSALTATLITPFLVYWRLGLSYTYPMIILSILLFWRHRVNIQCLLKGTESKIGSKE